MKTEKAFHNGEKYKGGKRRNVSASVVCSQEFMAIERRCVVFPVRTEINLYMLCRRK
jgi:hypothetical protein